MFLAEQRATFLAELRAARAGMWSVAVRMARVSL